jgi:hypothetical protein
MVFVFIGEVVGIAMAIAIVSSQWNRTEHEMVHLNIRRRDGGPIFRDWRHFQRIKNQLVHSHSVLRWRFGSSPTSQTWPA